ncbi:MAG: hypothetical protein BHW33_00990 [Firmicutes bacterium CAG:137_57_8]|nr:MAG: hypothetical protein BHW33_00990 [Firmicutes bacterium CAG:137_57_8]
MFLPRPKLVAATAQLLQCTEEPVERALLRLLIQARQFENLYSDSQNHPTFGPVFAQFRQEMVQAVRVLLFLLGSQGR